MKLLIIVALAVFGLANGKSLPTQSLKDDFEDFLALLPADKIVAIFMDYWQNDPEFQNVVEYVGSEDFKKIICEIEALKEFKGFVNYLAEQGLQVVQLLNNLNNQLGLPPYEPQIYKHKSTRRGSGLNGCIDDIIAILPIDDLKALFNEKLQTSPDFKNLIEALKSKEFQTIVDKLVSLPQYQDLKQKLRDQGIDIDKYIELIRAYFGWTRGNLKHTQSLEDDLQDFWALLPKDKILAIGLDYLANDPEVQAAAEYVQSDDFKTIVREVDNLPEYMTFLNYLKDSGLDVYKYVNLLHEYLGLPPLKPHSAHLSRIGEPGMKGLWNAVLAELPLEKLKALFYEKLETSADFKALVDRIKSDEFKVIVGKLQALPEYQDLKQRLRDKGIDVDTIIEVLKALIGWSY